MLVMGISLIHVISLITLLPSNVNLRTFLSFFFNYAFAFNIS